MVTDFPRHLDAPHGGVEAVSRTLALGLASQQGVSLHVVTSRGDVRRPYSIPISEQLTVHYLPRMPRLELATLFLWERLLLRRLLRHIAPDVVHAHDLLRYPYLCGSLGY